jgi:D-alanyl-lipoteichoic acid acyltransferase DltB (MBOAT superfamily)
MLLYLAYGIVITFIGAYLIERKCKTERSRNIVFGVTLLLSFAELFILKEVNFFVVSAGHFGDIFNIKLGLNGVNLAAPMGISYYMLSLISYLTDVYRKVISCQSNIFKHALFTSYFPLLTSGPIIRYGEVSEQLFGGGQAVRGSSLTEVKHGIERMLWGLFKKLVIADRLAIIINTVYSDTDMYAGLYIVVAVILFAIQLYCDFSGCMDIVIGVSETFGIRLPENFNTPFFSQSLQDFWQRWHITLGAWSKDYLLYPLLKSAPMQAIGRSARKRLGKKVGRKIPTYLTLVVVWSFIGIWHAGSLKFFVVSGVIPGIFLMCSDAFSPTFKKLNNLLRINTETFSFKLFRCMRTTAIMLIPWTLVPAVGLGSGIQAFMAIFKEFNIWIFVDGSLLKLGIGSAEAGLLFFSVAVLIVVEIMHYRGIKLREALDKKNIIFRWGIVYLGIIAVLVFGIYGSGITIVDFIYGRF